jgi:glucose-1-phosphate adenylyltransferase
MQKKILGMIMAGGQGSRLQPLTSERAKPAVHFGGKYRIIDFVLNNFVNSGIYKTKILTQFKSDSLNRHVSSAWNLSRTLDQYVDLVPAQMRTGTDWYRGTADAIYQNVNLITDERPDIVLVFGGDHIYKMDVTQMIEYHLEKGALCTVSAIPVPLEEATEFGVIEIDDDGRMIGFEEKPARPKSMPGRPGWALCSMGNYCFHSKFLVRELLADSKNDTAHDFGKDIIPNIYPHYPVYVYDFTQNRIPGEEQRGYWRDVGTLQALYEATWTSAPSRRPSTSTTPSGRCAPSTGTPPPPSSCSTSRPGIRRDGAMPWTPSSPTAASSPAARSRPRCSRRTASCIPGPMSRSRSCSPGCRSGATPACARPSSRRTW